MTDRRVFFSEPERRAFLDGRKTMFRRSINPQPPDGLSWRGWVTKTSDRRREGCASWGNFHIRCPFGQPGDRIWVPEAFRIFDCSEECSCYDSCTCAAMNGKPIYRDDEDDGSKWLSAGRMQKSQSRILLEIVSVRVERLSDISEADAIAEGVEIVGGAASVNPYRNYRKGQLDEMNMHCSCARRSFITLWESINGPGSSGANPLVWVFEVRRVKQ